MKALLTFILTSFVASAAFAADPPPRIFDEGVNQGVFFNLNCVGAGVTCTHSGSTATLTVGGGGGGAETDPLSIHLDGSSTTTAQIPFALGLSVGSDTQILLDNDDALSRTLSFTLATNRVELTNPEIGGKTKIHGYNRIELTTNSKSWTLLDTGSSILTFDMDFAGTNNIFENEVTFTSGPLVASFMTASRPVVTDASKNLVSGSVSAPILLTAGAFGLDYNTTNLKLTSSKLNTIQDIATTSAPTFLDLTLGDNSSSAISITFDGSTNSTWTYDPTTASHQILTNGATAFSYPGYDVGVGIIDLDTTGARTALQVWSSGTSGNYPIGFWGGIFDDGSGAADIIGGIGLNANNYFAGTSARTFSGDIAALAATNEITGSNLTIGSGVQLVGLDVSGTTGAGTVTWGTGRYPVGIRVNNNSLAGADSYGIRLEEQTNGSTNNYEAFFVGGGGAFFRAVGQQVYSSAASTLDLDTATTGNLRVGGTAEYVWNSTKFDFSTNIADMTSGKAEMPAGTALPATCTVGEYFQDTDSNDCANTGGGDGAVCACKAANTWALVANI